MTHVSFHRTVDVERTPRIMQLESIFDVPPREKASNSWSFEFELPAEWNVGLIVGPSGSGKSTAMAELFPNAVVKPHRWPKSNALIDGFPQDLPMDRITAALSSVGFSSPPAWCRPFHTLSNGEQFRASIAHTLALASPDTPIAVDEFTSVVDRQVAKVSAAAVAKTVRRNDLQFVAVSCHYDIEEWLCPDWTLEMPDGALRLGKEGQRRPELDLDIHEATRDVWPLFAPHHYLSPTLAAAARNWVACVDGNPVAFNSIRHQMHPKTKNIKIGHRLVVLPDWQGVGIGMAFDNWVGDLLWSEGYRYHKSITHPALISGYRRSKRWRTVAKGYTLTKSGLRSNMDPRKLNQWSFEYSPPKGAKRRRLNANG